MKKRVMVIATASVVAVLVAGGLFASNMGFKLTYTLAAAGNGNGGTASGTSTLSLPYIPMTGLSTAFDLCSDINSVGGANTVASIERLNPSNNAIQSYNCQTGSPFNIVAQESYRVTVNSTVDYPIVGSHDPTLQVELTQAGGTVPAALGGGSSASGLNRWAYPYHSTALNAFDLCNEIDGVAGGGTVASITRLNNTPPTNTLVSYNCQTGTAFALTPGEGYDIQVTNAVVGWIPDHF